MPLLHQWTYFAVSVITEAQIVHSQVRVLMTFPPKAYTASSSTMKSQQEGSVLFSTKLIPPCPGTNVCGVCNSEVLPLNSAGQPRAITKAYIVLMISRTPFPKNSSILSGNM